MSEFAWGGTEVAEQPETKAAEPGTLAMSADEFAALEERVLRAVNLVKRERAARAEAEERATAAEARAAEQSQAIEKLQGELDGFRSEREQVRQRVEKVLSQLDTLEL
jgi:uncharacterized coiled-coil protein SlyX